MIERMDFPLLLGELSASGIRDSDHALSVMDQDEFRAFYERTARPLWSYLSRITGDRQQADDFLQEAYFRFLRAGARHENEAHRRNSLFQIATNVVRDAARRASRHQDIPIEDDDSEVGEVLISGKPDPEAQAATRTDLARAMQQLEPMQRELLWLAYAHGSSHEEIAGILGLRVLSVRTTLYRARKKLAAILTGSSR